MQKSRHNIETCLDTIDMIRSMCRYMSDERIAAYVKAPLDMVQRVRRNVNGLTEREQSKLWDRSGRKEGVDGDYEYTQRRVAARRGSMKLLEAIRAAAD